jgi:crotonobetainyl-CoA:carnitine CoA-transferase CaiB-like acyl-CoA transferase
LESPTARHRATVAEVPDAIGGTRRVIDSPYRFSHSSSGVKGAAPKLGEHNVEVLTDWTGLPVDEAEALAKAGILVTERDGGGDDQRTAPTDTSTT